MKEIIMITGNLEKWKIANDIFKEYNVKLLHEKMDTPEIQSYNVEEISKFSAKYAAEKLKKAVIKSDVGYYIEELGGFPGPYVKYINGMLKSEDILKMMEGKENRTIFLKECLTFSCPGKEIKQFINEEKATISKKAEGEGSTFDKIVIFEGEYRPKATNTTKHNFEHFKEKLDIYRLMADYIEKLEI